MARLPQPGGDRGSWGSVLNDFLSVEHNADGSLKDSATLGAYAPLSNPVFSGNVTVPVPTDPTDAVTKAYADDLVSSGVADASTVAKGKLQLAGDLAGNADTPLVAAGAITDAKVSGSANIAQSKIANLSTDLAAKETPAGAQAKVDTHAAASDPHGDRAYTNTQLSTYATRANPTFTGTVTVPTPTNNTDAATKAYVDTTAAAGTPDANNSTKGKIQLTGDLAGSADTPLVAAQAIDNSKVSNTAGIAQSKIANLTTDLSAKAPLNNPTLTGTVTVPTPTNNTDAATKAYVDTTAAAGTPDANNVTKGKLQLAGDLAGTATTPVIAAGAIDNAKVNASAAIAQSKIANLTTDLAGKETPAGAQAKVDTHVAATDPHGDRAYTDSQVGTINTITPGPGLYMDDLGGNVFELGFDGALYAAGTGVSIVDDGDGTYTISGTSTAITPTYFFDETSGGEETYTFPAGARFWQFDLAGGSGGGGSGRRGAPGTLCYGGGAGQAGSTYRSPVMRIPAATIKYSLGAAGTGGAAVTTDDTNGNNGTSGGESYVGNANLVRLISILGGEGGSGGTATNGLGGGRALDIFGVANAVQPNSSMFGSNGTGPADNAGTHLVIGTSATDTTAAMIDWTMYMSCSGQGGIGGGGGGIKVDNTASTPGAGANSGNGQSTSRDGSVAWRLPGIAGTNAVKNGGSPTTHAFAFGHREEIGWGSAAGGGYPGISVAAGNGGSAVGHGDAPGGGGASRNGFNSGAGGNGVPGFIRIWCW